MAEVINIGKCILTDMNGLEQRLFDLLEQMRTDEVKQSEEERRPYYLHGLCAVLGYRPESHSSYFKFEAGRDILQNQDIYLRDAKALPALQEAMEIDGAILIGPDGKLMHSGRFMLSDLEKVYSDNQEALATYKYLQKVSDAGTRHIAAIALSAQQPELFFYALKSDHPELRIFKGGRVVHSTVPGEVEHLQGIYNGIPKKAYEHQAKSANQVGNHLDSYTD